MPLPTSSPRIAAIQQAWSGLIDPHTGLKLVGAKALEALHTNAQGQVVAEIALPYPHRRQEAVLHRLLADALQHVADAGEVAIHWNTNILPHAVPSGVPLLAGVKNMVAVASAKGGVGKSTTAANLALALAAQGARVGLLDADIYGPSIPLLMNVRGNEPEVVDDQRMLPLENHGIQIMSMGFLVGDDKAVVWRAPMALKALNQLLHQTRWGTPPDGMLDYLIVDMPPGTGDIQLTMSQRVALTAAVVVTTPQDLALADVRKGVAMFQKVGVPVLGVVENMAVHICSQCGHHEHVFGANGGKALAQAHGLPYLGALPLSMHIRAHADAGTPTVVADPESETARIYHDMALQVATGIARLPLDHSHKFPPIRVAP